MNASSCSLVSSVRTSTIRGRSVAAGRSRGWLSAARVCCGIFAACADELAAEQPAVLSTSLASNQIVVFPDASNPPNQLLVQGLPVDAQPHGIGYYGSDNALVADVFRSRIFVIKVSTATLLSTIDTAAAGYDGSGTLAVSPDGSAALAMMGGSSPDALKLKVIHAPFNASSQITQVDIAGRVATYQTQGIVFNSAGRAFMLTTGGIFVLDPPYSAVAFSFYPSSPDSGGIAISPDGNTLLTTCACTASFNENVVKIFHAPYSESSTSVDLIIPNAGRVDGIAFAPDGSNAIVASNVAYHAAVIHAPFSFDSVVETFTLPPGGTEGFEDVGISADSQIAILTGQNTTEPPVFIRAPFTAAGAVTSSVPIAGANPGRGQGAVRFRPAGAIVPPTPSQVVSRKQHNGMPFDIPLPLTQNAGVECRTGGAGNNYQLVLTFPAAVTFTSAAVTTGTGSVNGTSGGGTTTVTINLTGVTNAQRLTVRLVGVNDGTSSGNVDVPLGVLIGDVSGDGLVNAGDATITRNRSGQTTSAGIFRSDFNADGFINAADTTIVRSRSGTFLP